MITILKHLCNTILDIFLKRNFNSRSFRIEIMFFVGRRGNHEIG